MSVGGFHGFMLHVTEADVKRLLPFSTAIDLVRDAYVKLARGEATNPPRAWLSVPNGASMFFMPAYVDGQLNVTVKAARVNPTNSQVSLPTVLLTVYVYHAVTGVQIAEIDGEWLTAVRTAASTAVATDLLASKSVGVLGVFGSGIEAMAHIPALSLVRNFDRVIVYSRNQKRREAFAEKMSRETGIIVEGAASSDRVARESDVIVTATTSTTPVFDGSLVKHGSHVNAIGSAVPEHREIDSKLVGRSRLIVDSRTQALATYGDVIMPLNEGVVRESDIIELGELMNGRLIAGQGHVTLFKAGGLAVLDAMVTDHIVKLVLTQNPSMDC